MAEEIEPTERAHGDGIDVSGESPEAFEEMIWKEFWLEHYDADQIRPWGSVDSNPGFNSFFESHTRKVIAPRSEQVDREEKLANGLRYLSKNNLNIARLAAPLKPLRTGPFLIPFRDPVQQAASMKRQHDRFLEIHEEDDFVREYMEAIGHHEFGKGLKPVNFGGWLDDDPGDPNSLTFWLRYWTVAYRFVLDHAGEETVFLSYARLTEKPGTALSRLADTLELPQNPLTSRAEILRSSRTHSVDRDALPSGLRKEAAAVYEALDERAVG